MTQLQTLEAKVDQKVKELNELYQAIEAERAYMELNNLYLDIQAGRVTLTRRIYNQLQDLLQKFEAHGSSMYEWWWKEFQRLPGWLNV